MVLTTVGVKADTIEAMIVREAVKQQVDPQIAIAIARVESNLNPDAMGFKGEVGLFQIMLNNAGNGDLWDIQYNIKRGIELLKDAFTKCSDMGEYWPICYNNGVYRRPNYPQKHPYYKKFLTVIR